jgi:S-adenosylmethionine decarboxylase
MKNKGNHVFLDFINFYDDDLNECSKYIFDVMKDSISQTNMRAMFEKMVILKDDTEEGFTSVILLDESHITAHSYTKRGLLALDVFTCGQTNPETVAKYVKEKLEEKYPKINCINYATHKRFLYDHDDEITCSS